MRSLNANWKKNLWLKWVLFFIIEIVFNVECFKSKENEKKEERSRTHTHTIRWNIFSPLDVNYVRLYDRDNNRGIWETMNEKWNPMILEAIILFWKSLGLKLLFAYVDAFHIFASNSINTRDLYSCSIQLFTFLLLDFAFKSIRFQ